MTLCKDFECPLRNSCMRYLKTADNTDSFFEPSPRRPYSDKCVEFMQWRQYTSEVVKVARVNNHSVKTKKVVSSFRPLL